MHIKNNEKEQVTLEKLSEMFDIKLWTLRRYAAERRFPLIKLGSRIYVNIEDFREWLKQHEIRPDNEGVQE